MRASPMCWTTFQTTTAPNAQAIACAVGAFTRIGEELGLPGDDEITGLVAELLRWDLERRLSPEDAAEILGPYEITGPPVVEPRPLPDHGERMPRW